MNRIKPASNVFFSLFALFISVLTLFPLLFVLVISFSSEASIALKGYSFFPTQFSLGAYRYLLDNIDYIGRAFLLSSGITLAGTCISLWLIGTMAFALSQQRFCFCKAYTLLIIIPMFFSGGLVASYVVNTQVLGLKNNVLALILPQACSSWYILVMRTYFKENLVGDLLDAAKIDGAGTFKSFVSLVIPLCKPIFTIIGLFEAFAYWNSWYYAMLYIRPEHKELYPLQYVLYALQKNAELMATNDSITGAVITQIPAETFRMAVVVIITIPVIITYPLIRKHVAPGIMAGAIKY